MTKALLLGLLSTLLACAHPNPRGAIDEMVGTVGGAYRNISNPPSP
ncbi:hypothetical protein [Oligella urethralis]|nr:hypothetical protein [Oligella urethralis]